MEIKVTLHGDFIDPASFLTVTDLDGNEVDMADEIAQSFNNWPDRLAWLAGQPGQSMIIEIEEA